MKRDEVSRESDEQPVLTVPAAEGLVALVIFLLGGVIMYGAHDLGAGWAEDGPQAGYFPFYIGLIICVTSVINFYHGVFGKKRKTGLFVTRGPFKRVLSVLIPAAIFVGMIQLIGIYVAAAIYIAYFMMVLGKYSWWKSVAIAVGINAAFFLMFEVWFLVPLYKGTYNLLSFTGY